MSTETAFRKRAKEVRAYLRSLGDIEQRSQLPGRGFYRAAKAVTASRAAAYLMIYNCVEFAVRSCIVDIRRDVKTNVRDMGALKPYWRKEIIRAHFERKLQGGVNHGNFLDEVADFFPGTISWMENETAIPFNGNVDHLKLDRLARDFGAKKWKAPKGDVGRK